MIDEEIDWTIAAPCGLYCGNCTIFRAYFDRNTQKAEEAAKFFKCEPQQIKCSGCRADPKFCWSEDCTFKKCVLEKDAEFCYQCTDYPCQEIKKFAESAPHHGVVWENFNRMKEVGWRQWLKEQDEKWRCGVCRAKLDFYDEACPVCGIPVEKHD